jgi:magnesium chelatase subunit D
LNWNAGYWIPEVARVLLQGRGVRIGETAVLSYRVHTIDPSLPDRVEILSAADAGQVFYGRSKPFEVLHVDIFHEVGEVDHHEVGAALLTALAGLPPADLDRVDIQTGTGGGRLTGSLACGRKASLQAAHKNHVHLSLGWPIEDLGLAIAAVDTVERLIERSGLEIRRVECLAHRVGNATSPSDLSPYADNTDSALRECNHGQEGDGVGPPSIGAGRGAWDQSEGEMQLAQALSLATEIGSPDEASELLDQLEAGGARPWDLNLQKIGSFSPGILKKLEDGGWVKRSPGGLSLTESGSRLRRYLNAHLKEVKLQFRKLVRRLPGRPSIKNKISTGKVSPRVRYGPIRGTVSAPVGHWLGDVALPETLIGALKRGFSQGQTGLQVTREDIQVYVRAVQRPLNICLLIDASASMAGRRLRAAKYLARHLLLSTRDKVAVVAFQERDVRVYAPFSRDFLTIDHGLRKIQPLGLTPLAHGLTESLDLIQSSRAREPLLLLITDGIPTVPKWTIDPLADALEAARKIGRCRINFGCIGLQPSKRYLEELTRAAGGSLYVVDELDEGALVSIAHQERRRQGGG